MEEKKITTTSETRHTHTHTKKKDCKWSGAFYEARNNSVITSTLETIFNKSLTSKGSKVIARIKMAFVWIRNIRWMCIFIPRIKLMQPSSTLFLYNAQAQGIDSGVQLVSLCCKMCVCWFICIYINAENPKNYEKPAPFKNFLITFRLHRSRQRTKYLTIPILA